MHFMFECPAYAKIWGELYKSDDTLQETNDNMEKFKLLRENPNVFSNFISQIWLEQEKLISK